MVRSEHPRVSAVQVVLALVAFLQGSHLIYHWKQMEPAGRLAFGCAALLTMLVLLISKHRTAVAYWVLHGYIALFPPVTALTLLMLSTDGVWYQYLLLGFLFFLATGGIAVALSRSEDVRRYYEAEKGSVRTS